MLRRLTIGSAALAAIVAVVFAACGGPTTLDVTKYDRTCNSSSDCAAVSTDACCGCPTSAINKSALSQYEADLSAAAKNCGTCTEKPCAAVLAQCNAGLCTTPYGPDAGQPDAGSDAAADANTDASPEASTDAAGDAQDAAAD